MKKSKPNPAGLQRALEDLERTDPKVAAAAKRLDGVVRDIINKPILDEFGDPPKLSYEAFQKKWKRLSYWRKEWVKAKANASRMGLWAVLNRWEPPSRRECEQMFKKEEST